MPLLNMDCLLQGGVRAVSTDGPVLIILRKHHREAYAGRTVERKCQTKGCWGQGILLKHRGQKFLECRIHLQSRLDQFGPPAHGILEKRRDSRTHDRDSSADTNKSYSSTRKSLSKDVSFGDCQSDCSDVSSVSMPELQAVEEEHDELLPPPRTSTLSDVSVAPSQLSDHGGVSNTDMAREAADLMKRSGRRSSLPDLAVSGAGPPRQNAYSFDDEPAQRCAVPVVIPKTPVVVPVITSLPVAQ